jgi:Flp pilus assembly protein TadD
LAYKHPEAIIYGWLGDACQRLNELDSAMGYYEIALDKIGRLPSILNNVGTTYIKQNESEKAIKIFQELLNLDSSNIDYAYNLARSYCKLKDFGNAFPIVQKYLELYPNDYGLYNLQGLIFAKQGQFDAARKSWTKSLQIKPKNNNALENLNRLPPQETNTQ